MSKRLEACTPSESLGSGCCGEVFSVENDPDLVLKKYVAIAVDRAFLQRTFRRMGRMPGHPGIETILDHGLEQAPYVALARRVGGERLDRIPSPKETLAWTWIRGIAEALAHAHKHGIYHAHLHPGTIRLNPEGSPAPATVTDFGTGLVGEIHHIDLGNSIYYAAPEQLACGGRDWMDGHLKRWDVYSFGLVAYFLVHGDIPRGKHHRKRHAKESTHADGRPTPFDLDALLEEIHSEPAIHWGMRLGVSREHRLYREIIEKCLALDPAERPVDMREVVDEFRSLDHQFALEHAEERVIRERRKQRAKLVGARSLAAVLGISFALASYYLIDYLEKTSFFQSRVSELDQVVLTQKATIHDLDERWAKTVTDLKSSREAADAFFHKMARGDSGGDAGVDTLNPEELEKSREYYLETLADVSSGEAQALERGRALHSLAHIERKLGLTDKAIRHFEDAAAEFEALLDRGVPDTGSRVDIHLRLADCREGLGTLVENPVGIEALAALRDAVGHFEAALSLDPDNEDTVSRQAGTTFLLGQAYDAHGNHEFAIEAYSRSAELATTLQELMPESSESLIELIGELQFHAADSLARAGRVDEAIDSHIASMETLEKLRSINGFTPLQSIRLASSYLELGLLFEKKEATPEERDQLFNESLRLLTPLNTSNPDDVEVAMLLCRSLVQLGKLEREDGQWTNGFRLSVRGIEALQEALDSSGEPHVPGYSVLAESRLEHLDFLEREEEAARTVATRGVDTAEIVQAILDEGEIDEPILSNHRRRLGAIFREFAEWCELIGETELARSCREQAALQVAALVREEDTLVE